MNKIKGVYMSDRISYKEVYELINNNSAITNNKIDKLYEKVDAVHTQATKTNGRVNKLEGNVEELKDGVKCNRTNISKVWVKVAGISSSIGLVTAIVMQFIV